MVELRPGLDEYEEPDPEDAVAVVKVSTLGGDDRDVLLGPETAFTVRSDEPVVVTVQTESREEEAGE